MVRPTAIAVVDVIVEHSTFQIVAAVKTSFFRFQPN